MCHELEGVSDSKGDEARVAATTTVHVQIKGRQSEVYVAVIVLVVCVVLIILAAAAWMRCFVRGFG